MTLSRWANHYEILEVDVSATAEEIKQSYRRLAWKYHPDRNPSPEASGRMVRINRAYAVLSDPAKRAEYDGRRMSNRPSATVRQTGENKAHSSHENTQPSTRPANEPPPDRFTVGSPKSDVFNLQGPPESYNIDRNADKEVWHYGRSFVEFSINPRVVRRWDDPDGVLKVKVPTTSARTRPTAQSNTAPRESRPASQQAPTGCLGVVCLGIWAVFRVLWQHLVRVA